MLIETNLLLICMRMFNSHSLAPPKYELVPDHQILLAVAGESPTIHFTVTSDNPIPKHPKHTIIREDSGAVRKDLFVIKGEDINFPEVQVNNSGTYVISCHNNDGLEGRQSFKLTITPGNNYLNS